jgi:hypothetical protein
VSICAFVIGVVIHDHQVCGLTRRIQLLDPWRKLTPSVLIDDTTGGKALLLYAGAKYPSTRSKPTVISAGIASMFAILSEDSVTKTTCSVVVQAARQVMGDMIARFLFIFIFFISFADQSLQEHYF